MFAVVTLEESDEVMVVASNWLRLDKTRCYWPPFKSPEKCTEAVRDRLDPLTTGKQWDILNIQCHGECDTYEQAKKRQEGIKQGDCKLATGLIKRPKIDKWLEIAKHPPSVATVSTSRDSTDGQSSTDDNEILQTLREIKTKVHENSVMLKKLVKEKPASLPAAGSSSLISPNIHLNPNLPLQSFEDVIRTEKKLSKTATRNKYVKYLSGLGGSGQKDVIKKIMQHVLIDDLVKQFNWQGRGEKKAFSNLVLVDIIKDAASRHNINRGDCETEIKKYLINTADRISRKRARDVAEMSTGPGSEFSAVAPQPFQSLSESIII